MKKIGLTLFIALIAMCTYAQTASVKYTYDASGNRINRVTNIYINKSTKLSGVEGEKPVTESWGEREVKVFPNPTKGNLKISITGGNVDDKYSYTVYDPKGIVILNGTINNIGEYPIRLDAYSPGIYIMMLTCNNETKTYKIIKQ